MSTAARRLGSAITAIAAVAAFASAALLVHCGSFDGEVPAIDGGLESATSADAAPAPIDAAEASCSADLQSDPVHCGSCDYSCGTALCFGGACVAERVGPVVQVGPEAHITTRAQLGGFTDDQPRGAGGGSPGYFYAFAPEATNPDPTPGPTFLDHPTFVAVGTKTVHFVSRGSTGGSIDTSAPLDESITGLASSPSGMRFAARTPTQVLVFDEMFNPQTTIPLQGPPGAPGFGFYGESALVLATSTGVVACDFATTNCFPVIDAPAVTELAVSGNKLVYATGTTVEESVLTSTMQKATKAPKPLMAGLAVVKRIVLFGDDTYVLDDKGIHTTRYGERILVPTLANPVLDFAVSTTWLYLLRADGLSRVRR